MDRTVLSPGRAAIPPHAPLGRMKMYRNQDNRTSGSLPAVMGILLMLTCLILASFLRYYLKDVHDYEPAFEMTNEVTRQVNSGPLALIMGEVRASLADVMWVKTGRYVHGGIAYSAHLNRDEFSRSGEVVNRADLEGAGKSTGTKTLIPHENEDYRGFIGRIHRGVQPWQDDSAPHTHDSGEELLPWYRMVTLSNPNHWRGYLIGTWVLSRLNTQEALESSIEYLDEGIRNNPGVFQLRLMKGRMLINQDRWRTAIPEFNAAIELALKQRPGPGLMQPPDWTTSDEEDFLMALRYPVVLTWRKGQDPVKARQLLSRALEHAPDEGSLLRLKSRIEEDHLPVPSSGS
jgi:tetratricopeptide (TPR) repeat protein